MQPLLRSEQRSESAYGASIWLRRKAERKRFEHS